MPELSWLDTWLRNYSSTTQSCPEKLSSEAYNDSPEQGRQANASRPISLRRYEISNLAKLITRWLTVG
jgi:hypothetical protein